MQVLRAWRKETERCGGRGGGAMNSRRGRAWIHFSGRFDTNCVSALSDLQGSEAATQAFLRIRDPAGGDNLRL